MHFMHEATREPHHKWIVGHSQDVALISDTLNHILAYQIILAHHLQGTTEALAACCVS